MDTLFFVLSKVLPTLLYPLPLVLIFFGILGFRQKGTRRKLLLLLPALLLWILSTPAFLNLGLSLWEFPVSSRSELKETYATAVILGGLSNPELSTEDYVEFTTRSERILVPLELYREGKVQKILITSGSGSLLNQEMREADSLGDFARRWGVADQDLFLERESRNTYENALFTKRILDKQPPGRLLLVTSAFHMKRSSAIFLKQGFQFTPYSVDTMKDPSPFPFNVLPDPGSLGDLQALVKEIVGYGTYALMGYL